VDGRVPICILFYHVVANRPVNHMTVLLEDFVDQIEFLRRYVEIVSLDEAVRRLRSGRNDRLAVAITFDDGYQDNAWAIEYLRYHRLPAAFFVSIGHVCDGTPFEHDRLAGFAGAAPMQKDQLQRLTASNLLVGSHGCHHEDFGRLDLATADRVLRDSREVITEITGSPPEHFAFPIGQRAVNITRETFQIAQKHYNYLYSAYGGYNFPRSGRTHFLRAPHPMSLVELAMLLDGYTGFRNVLSGNGWGRRTDSLPPY
jgi:peptidoglycan/xylan/chitin deacetylase (PgdA/CDA1 family)